MPAFIASVAAVIVGGAAFVGGAVIAPSSAPTAPDLIQASAGVFDLRNRDSAAELRLGYRHEIKGWVLRPFVSGTVTSDKALHACAGIAYDLPVGPRFVFTPSFAPGLYSRGDGFDLGHTVEF